MRGLGWTVILALVAGCHHGDANVIGTVSDRTTEFVVRWDAPTAHMFVRSKGASSLEVWLGEKADVDQTIAMIETGLHATPSAAGDVVLARMNTGRSEARVVANGERLTLEFGYRADAAPAPTFSIALTPQNAAAIEDLLRRTKDRLAR